MLVQQYNELYAIRLLHGENFLTELTNFSKKFHLKNGIIVNGIGMLNHAKIGYFEDGTYRISELAEPAELISTNGNCYCLENGQPEWHIHVALAQKDHTLVGGHLLDGTVWNTGEIFLQVIPNGIFTKKKEEDALRLFFG